MRVFSILSASTILAACAGAPNPEKLTFSRDAGAVSGVAGANWSDEDLRKNSFGAVCLNKGEKVVDLIIGPRNEDGEANFSATCQK